MGKSGSISALVDALHTGTGRPWGMAYLAVKIEGSVKHKHSCISKQPMDLQQPDRSGGGSSSSDRLLKFNGAPYVKERMKDESQIATLWSNATATRCPNMEEIPMDY